VHRAPNPADRRSVLVELTADGRRTVQDVRTLIHRNEKAWMSSLSDAELRAYIDLHHRVQEGVGGE
jgi:DNA-binding MarR family transcriptional regulator